MNTSLISPISPDAPLWHTPCSLKHNPLKMCLARTNFQLHRWVEGRGRGGWNVSGLLPLVAPPGHTTHTWYRHTHARAQTYIRLFLHRLPVSCWLNQNAGDHDLQFATCASIQSLGFSTDANRFCCKRVAHNLLTHFLSRQETHSFGAPFEVCVPRCDVKCLCGERQQTAEGIF